MTQEVKPRLLRVVDHVAELLEARAATMPPSYKAQADILRNAARIYREIDNPKMVKLSEELPELNLKQKPAKAVSTKNEN